MLAGIFRTVLLKYASHYLSNVDVNNLSLWNGKITLENLTLNCQELNNTLSHPLLVITSGTIEQLELNIPWASLTSKSTRVYIKNLALEIDLQKHDVSDSDAVETSELEETLISKIVANLNLEIEKLSVIIRYSGNIRYVIQISLDRFVLGLDSEEEFLNPFKTIPGGTEYKVSRKLEIYELSVRVLSGKPEENISQSVLEHKFEKSGCVECALCHAFKVSSYYTMLNIFPTSFTVLHTSCSEISNTVGQSRHIKLCKNIQGTSLKITWSGALRIKGNFVEDSVYMRDVLDLVSNELPSKEKFVSEKEAKEKDQDKDSWFSWGKDMILSPFYCSQPMGKYRIIDEIYSNTTEFKVSIPNFHLSLKIQNTQDFEQLTTRIAATNFYFDTRIQSTSSTEGSFIPQALHITNGHIDEMLMVSNIRRDYLLVQTHNIDFRAAEDWLSYESKNLSVQVTRGASNPSQITKVPKLRGRLEFREDLHISGESDPVSTTFSLEELTILMSVILQLKSFYFRLAATKHEPPATDLSLIMHRHSQQVASKYISKMQIYENTITALKKHSSDLSDKLAAALDEIASLRKVIGDLGSLRISNLLNEKPGKSEYETILQKLPVETK